MKIVKQLAVAALVAGLVGAPVIAGAAVSDSWITTKAKLALMTTKDISSTKINVDTVDGAVTLHGKVNSTDEKARAEAEVRKIDGVKEVRNLLQIVPERMEKIVKASDKDVKDRVQRALKQNTDLRDSSITVASVNEGVVLLSGKANSADEHLEAIQTTRAVPGVRKVESEITSPDKMADADIRRRAGTPTAGVKGRSFGQAAKDTWITSDVKMRLLADEKTPATDINVDTNSGVVTLFGSVPSQDSKRAAEMDARKVNGVSRVVNELEVVPKSQKENVKAADDQLESQIDKKLKDRDDLHGASIDVDVKNAVARLTGTVESEHQRLSAAIAARAVPGVRAVHDELKIKD